MLFKLGQLFTAAGLVSYLQEQVKEEHEKPVTVDPERKGRMQKTVEWYAKSRGIDLSLALEELTGITDITRGARQATSS